MRRTRWIGSLALLAATMVAAGSPLEARGRERDAFKEVLYEAELVMSRQEAIGLTAEQRRAIVAALQRTQSEVVPYQLELSAAGERLIELLRPREVDLDAALELAAEAMRLESEVKLRHVRLLIEIKNLLTREQQRRLDELREER